MASFTKQFLSGSTNGRGIKISQTSTAGNILHTAISGTTSIDEAWIYAVNTSTSAVTLTFEYGEVTAPDGNINISLDADSGLILCLPGLILNNSLVIRAYASIADVVVCHGYINRIA